MRHSTARWRAARRAGRRTDSRDCDTPPASVGSPRPSRCREGQGVAVRRPEQAGGLCVALHGRTLGLGLVEEASHVHRLVGDQVHGGDLCTRWVLFRRLHVVAERQTLIRLERRRRLRSTIGEADVPGFGRRIHEGPRERLAPHLHVVTHEGRGDLSQLLLQLAMTNGDEGTGKKDDQHEDAGDPRNGPPAAECVDAMQEPVANEPDEPEPADDGDPLQHGEIVADLSTVRGPNRG